MYVGKKEIVTYSDLYFCIFVFLYFCIFVFLYFCIFVFLYFCIFVFLYFCIFVFLYFSIIIGVNNSNKIIKITRLCLFAICYLLFVICYLLFAIAICYLPFAICNLFNNNINNIEYDDINDMNKNSFILLYALYVITYNFCLHFFYCCCCCCCF